MLKKVTFNGETFNASPKQIEALELLASTNKGSFAVVHDYVSTSNRVKPETADITFISGFAYGRLNQRKREALEALQFEDVKSAIKAKKLTALTEAEQKKAFEDRKTYLIASIDKTASGDRDDSRREAHDRVYARICDGIRVHFKTVEITVDGKKRKEPVTIDGAPIVDSIMVEMIEIKRNVKVPGEYKVVDSGVPVLIGNLIESELPKGAKFKNLSLKDDNFTSLKIGGHDVTPADIKGIFPNGIPT
jgi:hypothetical protein